MPGEESELALLYKHLEDILESFEGEVRPDFPKTPLPRTRTSSCGRSALRMFWLITSSFTGQRVLLGETSVKTNMPGECMALFFLASTFILQLIACILASS